MKSLLKILRDFPAYLWSGWGAVASIFLFIACWEVGSQIYGTFILPSPQETFGTLYALLDDTKFLENLLILVVLSMMLNLK